MASREEIRPEVFSYLFIALFLWLLWRYKENIISCGWLYLLPVLEILWINLHIYFFFGFFLIMFFLFTEILTKKNLEVKKLKNLCVCFILVLGASFILLLIIHRKNFSFAILFLGLIPSAMGWFAIRNFALFGFFSLVVISHNFKNIFSYNFKFNALLAKRYRYFFRRSHYIWG